MRENGSMPVFTSSMKPAMAGKTTAFRFTISFALSIAKKSGPGPTIRQIPARFITTTTLSPSNASDLAEAYLTEFNEMWGGTSGPPGACRFSSNKETVVDNHHVCNGVTIDVYFSPTKNAFPDTAYDAIMNQLDQAEDSVQFCMYTFTQSNLSGKLIQLHNARHRGAGSHG